MARIFISYRRGDSDSDVGRLADDLRRHFPPEKIFQDIASIDPGAPFKEVLDTALATAGAVLVVIGPRWLSATDKQGRKRLEQPGDWVRQEVAESLRRGGVRVFPLLVGGAEIPGDEDLPGPLKPLADRQAFELTYRHWPNDLALLVQYLKRAPGLAEDRKPDEDVDRDRVEQERTRGKREDRSANEEARRRVAEEQARQRAAGEARRRAEDEARNRREETAQRKLAEPGTTPAPKPPGTVPWKLLAVIGAAIGIALLVFVTLRDRPEQAITSTTTPSVASPSVPAAAPAPAPPAPSTPAASTPEVAQAPITERPVLSSGRKRHLPPEPPAGIFEPGQRFREDGCPYCPEMVVIPAGEFTMGSPEGEAARDKDEGPQRQVRIAYPFAVAKYEVTFDDWDACMAAGGCAYNPDDDGWGRGRRPVINVSWEDAQTYVSWLAKRTGKRYRLLSEAEWEYAARAGTTTRYPWGEAWNTNRANFDASGSRWSGKQTAPVGSFEPNAFGLHDMIGNVWEWVQDCWSESYKGAPADARALESGDCGRRVVRGGSWSESPLGNRSANRVAFGRDLRARFTGFRVARTL